MAIWHWAPHGNGAVEIQEGGRVVATIKRDEAHPLGEGDLRLMTQAPRLLEAAEELIAALVAQRAEGDFESPPRPLLTSAAAENWRDRRNRASVAWVGLECVIRDAKEETRR
jgi:hypothetical protein